MMDSGMKSYPSKQSEFDPQQSTGDSIQHASLEAVTRGRRIAAHQLSERPLSVLALGFVVGAGAGTLIGSLLFDHLVQRQASTAGLLQRISDTVSEAVSQARS